jgi:hypothetical protein
LIGAATSISPVSQDFLRRLAQPAEPGIVHVAVDEQVGAHGGADGE